jgi:hypothetical protein
LLVAACGPGDNVFVLTGDDAIAGDYLATGYGLVVRTSDDCGMFEPTFSVTTVVGDYRTEALVIGASIELVQSDEGLTRAEGQYPVGAQQVASFVIYGAPLDAAIWADSGTFTLIDPIEMELSRDAESPFEYTAAEPLRFEINARADGVEARGRFELSRQHDMDTGVHESCY